MEDEEIDEAFLDLLDEGMSNAAPLSLSVCAQIARIQRMAEESRKRELERKDES